MNLTGKHVNQEELPNIQHMDWDHMSKRFGNRALARPMTIWQQVKKVRDQFGLEQQRHRQHYHCQSNLTNCNEFQKSSISFGAQ